MRKYQRMEKLLKIKFAESIAPGQERDFIEQVLSPSNDDQDNQDLPEHIQNYLKMYNESDSMGKLVILSMLDHSNLTKQRIMEIFNCSKYRIDLARHFHASSKGLVIPEKGIISRNRLDLNKCEHFLEWIFMSGLLQDVAYGVSSVKYDSGEVQKVANAILTTKYSHTIAFYKEICRESQYTPLSDSSLWRILHAIKPSQRKSLV